MRPVRRNGSCEALVTDLLYLSASTQSLRKATSTLPMEAPTVQTPVNGPLPPYEAWPSAPKGAFTPNSQKDITDAMDLDKVMSPDNRDRRAASVLSMDDIEAAQALEGLRAGKESSTD